MRFTSYIFLLTFLWGAVHQTSADSSHTCELRWVNFLSGSPITADMVEVDGAGHYVARLQVISNWVGGWLDAVDPEESGLAYFAVPGGGARTSSIFQVLTNPNDCALSWKAADFGVIPPEDEQFAVRVDGDSTVGRGRFPETHQRFIGGDIRDNEGQRFVYVTYAGLVKELQGAQYLRSSANLRLQMSRFIFQGTLSEGVEDFLGLDLISNNANVDIEQTITHRKMVKKSYSFTQAQSFRQVTTFDVSLSLPAIVPGFKLDVNFTYTRFNENKETLALKHEDENEVLSLRTIRIPSFHSIQACSVVTMETDLEIPYWSRGRFSVMGYDAGGVRELLLEAGYDEADFLGVEGYSVVVNITGSFTVTTPMKTAFVVLAGDDPEGCHELQAKIGERRALEARARGRGRVGGATQDEEKLVAGLNAEIKRIIHGR